MSHGGIRATVSDTPPTERSARGRWAEAQARRLLEDRGLCLLEKNYRCRMGELDLIMNDRGTLVIAEVRYRRTNDFGTAAESVDGRKQRKLVRTTEHFLRSRPDLYHMGVRFDVIGVTSGSRESELEWIKDAFQA